MYKRFLLILFLILSGIVIYNFYTLSKLKNPTDEFSNTATRKMKLYAVVEDRTQEEVLSFRDENNYNKLVRQIPLSSINKQEDYRYTVLNPFWNEKRDQFWGVLRDTELNYAFLYQVYPLDKFRVTNINLHDLLGLYPKEIAPNPEKQLLAYSTESGLYIFNMKKKTTEEIYKSDNWRFEPYWDSDLILEYKNPETSKTVYYSLK